MNCNSAKLLYRRGTPHPTELESRRGGSVWPRHCTITLDPDRSWTRAYSKTFPFAVFSTERSVEPRPESEANFEERGAPRARPMFVRPQKGSPSTMAREGAWYRAGNARTQEDGAFKSLCCFGPTVDQETKTEDDATGAVAGVGAAALQPSKNRSNAQTAYAVTKSTISGETTAGHADFAWRMNPQFNGSGPGSKKI